MGHVGLTPQSVHRMGGHRVQGRRHGHAPGGRERVIEDAKAVEAAGAFAVVLECIPLDLAAEITATLSIPTIGIGAGAHCDGQVLVLHDLIGLSDAWTPRFAKRYAELGREVVRAAEAYVHEVKTGAFPTEAQAFAPAKAS
jgi:3-methyl-2-oxobutanoate hydroxymethyltransferase